MSLISYKKFRSMKVRWYFYINHYPILYTNSFSYAILPTSHTERVWRDLIRSGRLLTVLDKLFFQVKSSHWGLIDENEHAIALEEKA